MPIYEYRCPNGHTFEIFQRMSDAPVEVCEVCAAGPVEKVLFPVAVHFKGKGFYATDYGKASRSGAGKESKEGGDSGSSAKETKSGDAGSKSSSETKTSSGEGGSSSPKKSE